MMDEYINEKGIKCFRGVDPDTKLADLEFQNIPDQFEDDKQVALHTNLGTLTVLNRMTGFGHRDIETGYRAPDGTFWLASGMFDIRWHSDKSIAEAIKIVKENANNCIACKPSIEAEEWLKGQG